MMDSARGGKPLDLSAIETFSLRHETRNLPAPPPARLPDIHRPLADFYDTLPRQGQAAALIDAAEHIVVAAANQRRVIAFAGARSLAAGLAPLLLRLIEQRIVNGLALDGAAAQRDFETACFGYSSEEIRQGIWNRVPPGLAADSGEWMNELIRDGARRGFGIGSILGRGLQGRGAPHEQRSLLATCAELRNVVTVHPLPGGEDFQLHPAADGAALGKSAMRDFQVLAGLMPELAQGGVLLFLDDSPVLPVACLKALDAATGVGHDIRRYVFCRLEDGDTCDPARRMLERAQRDGGKAYTLGPAPEICLPLLYGAIQRLLR